MRVKDCNGCKYLTRRRWSSYYKPIAYHAIGMTHAYAYCEKHKDVMTVWDGYCNGYDGYAKEDNLYGTLTDKEREEVWSEVQQEVQK